jgi:hypothetical protein
VLRSGKVGYIVRLAPQLLSAAGVQANQQSGFGSDVNTLTDQNGRGDAGADFGLPDDVLFVGPLGWRIG